MPHYAKEKHRFFSLQRTPRRGSPSLRGRIKFPSPPVADRENDATLLASSYDFSGGEIDNIVRKATIEEVVSGTAPTLERLTTLCREEKITTPTSHRMGF